MINNQYPFSQWTEEWKVLEWLSGEERQVILESSWIVDYAIDINDTIDQILISNDKSWEEKDESEEDILNLDNPRVRAFNSWINWSEENKTWYENNKEKLKLVQDNWEICVEMLWDVFESQDEKALENWKDIWNNEWNTYFTFDAAERLWKRIPDWNKYINFLPWSVENKINFLMNILWLSFAGFRYRHNGCYYFQSTEASYWSSSPYSYKFNLNFCTSSIHPGDRNYRANGFSVRCLKN